MGDLSENFSRYEFACKCGCGADNISPALVDALQVVRSASPFAISITSGVRCSKHNSNVGGASSSSHVSGLAADIVCIGSGDRYKFLRNLIPAVGRIGVAENFIHVDVDHMKPTGVLWMYPPKKK
jgi:zinc D-Ala-D-Ala carboxypeptidase